jgi:ribosomal protein S18 acetylase RimI-like enzyme
MQKMDFRFVPFRAEDFPEYLSWYKDEELDSHLGPMKENDEWLHHVLQRTDGKEYSVFTGNKLVAVVGTLFPDAKHPSYYITNFAMKPNLRAQGIGTKILNELIALHPLKKGESWIAFVDVRNPKAKSFFEKSGWKSSDKPDEHGMFQLVFQPLP